MTFATIQNSFSGGEISPSLFGRTDLAKWHNGASTMRNFFANYRGGASSRAGTAYVGTCKQPGTSSPPRDIPFQFNINQGYVLEFGDQYMRIKSNGAYVVESANAITGITKANPGIFTYTNTNYTLANGDWIFVQNVGGMTNFNGLVWIVAGVSGSTFHVTDLFGNAVNTTTFNAYTSGGSLERIYTVVSPYAAVDLPYLKFTQSADTMSLCCVNQQTFTEYPPYDLVRSGNTNWSFTQVTFGSSILPPSGVSASAQSSTTINTWYSYVVTAVDSDTGEESVAPTAVSIENNDIAINAGSNTITWAPVTGASSYNIYKATPSFTVQVPVGAAYGFIGNAFGTSFTDTNITADFTSVPPVHNNPFARGVISSVVMTSGGSGFTQANAGYSITTSTGSGFSGVPVVVGDAITGFIISNGGRNYANIDTIILGTTASGTYTFTGNPTNGQTIILNGITWTFTTGTPTGNQTKIHSVVAETLTALTQDLSLSVVANIAVANYTLSGLILTIRYKTIGTSGNAYTLAAGTYGGVVSGATLTGGSSGGATATLIIGPQTGTYPSVVAYYQQRRVYANTLNNPDTYYFSKPGAFLNMDSSVPVTDSDAIVGAPWAQQINGVQFMQPMTGGLIILTGNGAWNLNGGNNSALTPSDQTATSQAYNGCSNHVPPIVINYDILYVQSKGSIVRDLSYNFFVNIFTGTDTTILSNHLFNYHQVEQWAYAEEPYKNIWATRDDGIMLSLTYLKEQDVYAWARHDTNGFYVGVCSVTEPPVDAVYVIVKRYVQGQWVYYSERMDNRNWENAEDCFCVDAGLSYPMTFPNATLTPASPTGTKNISSVNLIFGGSGYTSPVINAIDETGRGTGATFTSTVIGGVITSITPLTQGENYTPGQTILEVLDSTGSGLISHPVITNNVVFTASAAVFNSGNVGNVIRIGNNNASVNPSSGITNNGGGRAIITGFTSSTQVTANIIQPITATIPNDPNNMPVPAISGQWSLSVPTNIVSGLNHLEGMQVAILADGSVVPNQIVSNGSVTLPQPYSAITIGLPYTCQLQTLYLEPPGQPTTIQGKRKNIYNVNIRVENSRGIQSGTNEPDQSTQPNNAMVPWTNMKEVKERNALVQAGYAIPLFTGDFYLNLPANWDTHGQVAVQQVYPLPADILAIITQYEVGDTNG